MYTINQLQEKISQEINSLNFGENPSNLYVPIKYMLDAGGKRIRPALALAACNMFSEKIEIAIPVALAFEIFHNFTLLHDDIMDNSPIRRNKETVHLKWNKNTAILSGDAMMIKAYDFLKDLPAELFVKVFPVFNDTALQVCEGQQYDMDFETQKKVSEPEYLNMIKLKTAVLIAASLKAGAICGGATDKQANLLYEFGLSIGLAFQIQDDLLDVYADENLFGKQNGNDILTGKKTFLLINALEKSDSETSKKLIERINNKSINDKEKIAVVIKIYDKLNIKTTTEQKIKKLHQKALNSLNSVPLQAGKKEELYDFANLLVSRKK
ncbi:MAG: polyprenyl synthetase family protein [Bacteroidales bacterium]|nr:polyprenyl synthetase family protein [Bacteroidales bacterium]